MDEEILTPLTLEEITVICTDAVIYSPHGYVIAEDGTIYALTQQYTHGVVMAILHPVAAQQWCESENEDYKVLTSREYYDVYALQRFGLDSNKELGYVTINRSMLVGFTVGKGERPATPEQLASVRRILVNEGLKDGDQVYSDYAEVSVKRLMANLARHNDDCTYQGEDDERTAESTEG